MYRHVPDGGKSSRLLFREASGQMYSFVALMSMRVDVYASTSEYVSNNDNVTREHVHHVVKSLFMSHPVLSLLTFTSTLCDHSPFRIVLLVRLPSGSSALSKLAAWGIHPIFYPILHLVTFLYYKLTI